MTDRHYVLKRITFNQSNLLPKDCPPVSKLGRLLRPKWALNFLDASLCHDLRSCVQDIFSRFSISVREREWGRGGRRNERQRGTRRGGRVTYYRNRWGQWGPAISDVHKVFTVFSIFKLPLSLLLLPVPSHVTC